MVLDRWSRFTPWALTLLRIVAAFLFWEHGAQKLLGVLGRDPVSFPSLLWFAAILEFFGGILVALGLWTRPVAFLLSGQMAVAYFMSHAPRGFWPVQNHGETAVLYCFVFLFLATAGPGKFSIDGAFSARREQSG